MVRRFLIFVFSVFFIFLFFTHLYAENPKTVRILGMPLGGLPRGVRCGNQITEIFVKAVPHEKKLYSKRYFTNKPIQLQVTANYNYIRQVLARDERGRVLSGILSEECTPKPAPLQEPYIVEVVEFRNGKIRRIPGNIWDAGPGYVVIKEQGRYRIRVKLDTTDPYKNPKRLGWAYTPVITVYDKSKDRHAGARVITRMMIRKHGDTVPFEESSLYFDTKCQNQPFKVCGECDRELEFTAYAKWGILEEETEYGGTLRKTFKPVPYRAYWELVNLGTGEKIASWTEKRTIRIRPSELGDGRYVLFARSKEQHEGSLSHH